VAITPDGPRGPFQVAALGVANIARLSQTPILPITFSASRHKRFKSWDRFMLALPFGKLVMMASAPIYITSDIDDETARRNIESVLNEQVAKADAIAGL
jgi:lysophospholipid acyltransferase (LPLAT)-like uncharacterized protein